MTLDWGTLAGMLTASVVLAGIVGLTVDKRRRDLSELYKSLYEGKSAEVNELTSRLTRLEARLEFYESDFTKKLAEGITSAIIESVERHWGDPLGPNRRRADV